MPLTSHHGELVLLAPEPLGWKRVGEDEQVEDQSCGMSHVPPPPSPVWGLVLWGWLLPDLVVGC